MLELMNAVKAEVKNGRLLVDEPTDLPDGTVIYLEPVEADDLSAEQRAELNAMLDESLDELEQGKAVDGEAYLAELRSRL